MEVFARRDLGGIMKKSVFIRKEMELLAQQKGVALNSDTINKALELYLSTTVFDCSELRKKKEYRLLTIRVHRIVITLLQELKANFKKDKVACEFVMGVIVKEFQMQSGRNQFPDRLYINLTIFNKWVVKLTNALNRQKGRKIQ